MTQQIDYGVVYIYREPVFFGIKTRYKVPGLLLLLVPIHTKNMKFSFFIFAVYHRADLRYFLCQCQRQKTNARDSC